MLICGVFLHQRRIFECLLVNETLFGTHFAPNFVSFGVPSQTCARTAPPSFPRRRANPRGTPRVAAADASEGTHETWKRGPSAPKYRPRRKQISVKYHHFWQHVKSGILTIKSIDTKEQLAYIFTKDIPRAQFEYLRNKIQGWISLMTKPSHTINTFLETLNFVFTWCIGFSNFSSAIRIMS